MTQPAPTHEKMLAMNEALLLGSLRQHELIEAAAALNDRLQKEISERKRAEATLRESEERFRTVFELGPVALYYCDASGVILEFNHRATELWGRTPAPLDTDELFCGSHKMFRPDGSYMPHEHCPMAEVLAGNLPEARDGEVLIERPDGSRVTVLVNIRPLKNQSGEITGAINCFYDITERKQAEQYQHLLMNELEHRGRNLLSIIHSVVIQSLSGAQSLSEASRVLTQRIEALARSQSAVAAQQYIGATVSEIVRLELEGFSDRVAASGPEIMLDPQRAQTLALVVHELATNASKYGALSVATGKVTIRWSAGEPDSKNAFKFRWQERNGPSVVPPTRRGFGRRLLESAVASDFSTAPKINFAPEGLSYEIDAPG